MGGSYTPPAQALLESVLELTGSHAPGHRRALVKDLLGMGMAAWRAHLLRPDPAAPAGTLLVTWLGVAGLMLDDGTTRLLVDPMVSRPSGWRVAAGKPLGPDLGLVAAWAHRLGLGPDPERHCPAVLVGHTHYDHALDIAAFARATGAVVVGSSSAANIARGAGLPETRIHTVTGRETLQFGAFEVRFLPSIHGLSPRGNIPYPGHITEPLRAPMPAAAWRTGDVFLIEIRHPQGSLLQQGSASVGPGTLQGVQVDVAMPCLAWRSSTPELMDATFHAVGAQRLVPLHFDNMFTPLGEGFRPLPSVNLGGFFKDIEQLGLDPALACLPIGVPVPLMASRPGAG